MKGPPFDGKKRKKAELKQYCIPTPCLPTRLVCHLRLLPSQKGLLEREDFPGHGLHERKGTYRVVAIFPCEGVRKPH